MIQKMTWLVVAGGLGTLARYGLSGLVSRINGDSFPWGTLSVNAIGCLLAGLVWALFESRWQVSGEVRTIVLVGFLGAFTTFSAFILETGDLVRSTQWAYAAANISLQNGIGFVALFAGVTLGRAV